MKIKFLLIILILLNEFTLAQNYIKTSKLKSDFVIKINKEKFYKNLERDIYKTFSQKLIENIDNWISALKNAESLLLKNNKIENALKKSLTLPVDKYIKLQKTALEYSYALYPNQFESLIADVFFNTKDKISFAIAVKYLLRINYKRKPNDFYLTALNTRFKIKNNSLLLSLKYDLNHPDNLKFKDQPDLIDLLNHPIQNGKTIVYSFQKKDRKYPGITIIKKPDGTFVKNKDGSIFHIPQLALSFSNLPGYLPNGNTPEGIYSIIGWYISPTKTIGPSPNLLVRSPFEVAPKIFFHNQNQHTRWNIEDYKNLLPDSWKDYFPIYNSFYAGKTGRKLIIVHGSTDEIKYFESQPYYPLTPTRGCLSSKEIWDEETGKCLQSDQVNLINAYKSTLQKRGFLIVIEIDDKQYPRFFDDFDNFLKNPQR